jgi:hypothetical protein
LISYFDNGDEHHDAILSAEKLTGLVYQGKSLFSSVEIKKTKSVCKVWDIYGKILFELLPFSYQITGLQNQHGNYLGNNIDRQVFPIPLNLIFLLLLSALAFGGLGLQLGVVEAISDLISKL